MQIKNNFSYIELTLSNKEEEKPAAVVQPKVEEVQTVVETKVNEIKEHFNAAEFEKKRLS